MYKCKKWIKSVSGNECFFCDNDAIYFFHHVDLIVKSKARHNGAIVCSKHFFKVVGDGPTFKYCIYDYEGNKYTYAFLNKYLVCA